jgi:hypothetical protein
MKWIGILIFGAVLFGFSDNRNAEEPIKPAAPASKPSVVAETSSSPIETARPGQQEDAAGQAPSSPVGPLGSGQQEEVAEQAPSLPLGPAGPAPNESMAGEGISAPISPDWPGQMDSTRQMDSPPGGADIFFAAGTVSADSKALYVIFDKLLMHYSLPELDLKRKVELDIAVAPVNPSISISEDGEFIYLIYNGILYQIDAIAFKVEKRIKITP